VGDYIMIQVEAKHLNKKVELLVLGTMPKQCGDGYYSYAYIFRFLVLNAESMKVTVFWDVTNLYG
jgi:hypothetical protein